MRVEAGRAEVLDICHRGRRQRFRRHVCAFRRWLTALIGEQAASYRQLHNTVTGQPPHPSRSDRDALSPKGERA